MTNHSPYSFAYDIGLFQHCQLEHSKMTNPRNLTDNSRLMSQADEIIKSFESARAQRGWSKMRMADEADVPYSWVIDFYRKKPLKPDMVRVQKIMNCLGLSNSNDPYVKKIVEKLSGFKEPQRKELMAYIHFLETKKD
jgi:hypothetical protein